MGHVVPFERPPHVPNIVRNTFGYPVLFGVTSLFFCALWVAQAAEAFQQTLDAWSGKEPNPKARIMPATLTASVVALPFHR